MAMVQAPAIVERTATHFSLPLRLLRSPAPGHGMLSAVLHSVESSWEGAMQKRTLIQIANAQRSERVRRERQEAARLLTQGPIVDESVQKLVADQFRELAEGVRQLQIRNA